MRHLMEQQQRDLTTQQHQEHLNFSYFFNVPTDTLDEVNETATITLSNASNATISDSTSDINYH